MATDVESVVDRDFESITLADLEAIGPDGQDALDYGVVGLDAETLVRNYNGVESSFSGLERSTVIGQPFFDAVAQCMNNFMVAQRFEDEAELDDIIPYVLTLRMRPTRVRLRLLAGAGVSHRYVLIER